MSDKRPTSVRRSVKPAEPSAYIAQLEGELQRAHEAIDALQESNGLLNALLENTDDFVLFSNDRGEPMFFNTAYARVMKELLGLEMRPGIKPHELLPDGEARAWWEGLHDRVLSGEKFRVTYEHELTPGDTRHYEVSFNPVREGDAVRGFSEFTRDVTHLRRTERARAELQQQLLQAQKMDALGQLAGGMAHDFNNLLAVILGTAELLVMTQADARQRDRLQKIVKMAQRGRELTTKLLAFARRDRPETRAVPAAELSRELLELLDGTIPPTIRVETAYEDCPVALDVAPGQLTLALLNICLNARDAMAEGGTLRLESGVVSLPPGDDALRPGCAPGDYLRLRIVDSGEGIAPEALDRVFEPFYTTKARGRGTGLGLAVSLGIVASHGGWIDLSSQLGAGTTAQVYLPCQRGVVAPLRPTPTPSAPVEQAEGTVLIVDDDPACLATLAEQMRALGYVVHTAAGGADAVAQFSRDPGAIDLVLLDVLMPGMDGRATFTALRGVDPAVKVVLCSGFSLEGQVSEILALGARDYLQKPFELTDLQRVVRDVLHAD